MTPPPTPPPSAQPVMGVVPRPPKLVSPRIWVERTFPDRTTTEEQPLEVRQFFTEPAKVRAEASRTINLGNYESIRIAVAVEMPCYVEEVEVGMQETSNMVSDFLNAEEVNIRKALAGTA